MIEEYAVITQCKNDIAVLELERRTACGICGQTRGCGNATWGKLLGHNSHTFLARNDIKAKVGDSVVVGIDERSALKSAFLLYVMPLLGLIVFSVFAEVFSNNQFYVMLSALVGLFMGFLWVKLYLMSRERNPKNYSQQYQAVVLRRAGDVKT